MRVNTWPYRDRFEFEFEISKVSKTLLKDPPQTIETEDIHLLLFSGSDRNYAEYSMVLNKFSMKFRPPMVFDEVNEIENFVPNSNLDTSSASCSVLQNQQMYIITGGQAVQFYRVTASKS